MLFVTTINSLSVDSVYKHVYFIKLGECLITNISIISVTKLIIIDRWLHSTEVNIVTLNVLVHVCVFIKM